MVIFMEISRSMRSMPTRNKSRDELITNLSKHLEWLMDFDIISKFYNGSYKLNDTSYSNLLQIKECIACSNKNVSDCILETATELATIEEGNYEVHSKLLSTFYVTTGYVISITSLIGICLNVLGIYILSIPSNRKTLLNFLLLSLLIFETIFLVFRIMRCYEKHLKSLQPNHLKHRNRPFYKTWLVINAFHLIYRNSSNSWYSYLSNVTTISEPLASNVKGSSENSMEKEKF